MKCMLIPEWKRAWRFSSVRLIMLGGVCQLTVMTLPEKVAAHTPEVLLQTLSVLALVSTFLAVFGRVTKFGRHVEPPPAPGGH